MTLLHDYMNLVIVYIQLWAAGGHSFGNEVEFCNVAADLCCMYHALVGCVAERQNWHPQHV